MEIHTFGYRCFFLEKGHGLAYSMLGWWKLAYNLCKSDIWWSKISFIHGLQSEYMQVS